MAVENLGLVAASEVSEALGSAGGSSCRLPSGMDLKPYVRFRTAGNSMYGFVIECEYRSVPRATLQRPDTGYGGWGNASSASLTSTSPALKSVVSNGFYEWAVPLSVIASLPWSFEDRLFDEMQVRLTVCAVDQSGLPLCPVASCDAWVGWIPDYEVSAVSYDLNSLDIAMVRPESWLRGDDRWCIEGLVFETPLGSVDVLRPGSLWGDVGAGLISVPFESLSAMPDAGMAVRAKVRVNASYKARGSTLDFAEYSGVIEDRTTCSTPSVSVSVHRDVAVVDVSNGSDKGIDADRVRVSLRGGYPFDVRFAEMVDGSARVVVDKLAAGRNVVEVIALSGSDSVSRTVACAVNVRATSAADALFDIDSGTEWPISLDPSVKSDYEPDMTVVKLAGRPLETVGYGVGGNARHSVSCSLKGAGALAEWVGRLRSSRRLLLRTRDGLRVVVALGQNSSDRRPWGIEWNGTLVEVDG